MSAQICSSMELILSLKESKPSDPIRSATHSLVRYAHYSIVKRKQLLKREKTLWLGGKSCDESITTVAGNGRLVGPDLVGVT